MSALCPGDKNRILSMVIISAEIDQEIHGGQCRLQMCVVTSNCHIKMFYLEQKKMIFSELFRTRALQVTLSFFVFDKLMSYVSP